MCILFIINCSFLRLLGVEGGFNMLRSRAFAKVAVINEFLLHIYHCTGFLFSLMFRNLQLGILFIELSDDQIFRCDGQCDDALKNLLLHRPSLTFCMFQRPKMDLPPLKPFGEAGKR